MLVIGRNPVTETLKIAPQSIKKIVILSSITDSKIKEIKRIAENKNIIVETAGKDAFEKILEKKDKSEGISQGIYAIADEYEYSKTTEILKALKDKPSTTLIMLDEIQDPHNFGAILRTAVSSGADGVIISDKNSVKVNHTVIKSSSGAAYHIRISKEPNIYKTIEVLKESGYKIIGTVLKNSEELYKFTFPQKSVLLFGSEGEGLRKNIINLCDYLVKIPMAGKIDSLNVSVSAGVILYEILRQRNY